MSVLKVLKSAVELVATLDFEVPDTVAEAVVVCDVVRPT